MADPPSLSVIVPLYNEEENVALIAGAVRDALASHGPWELLLVDDGSTDATARIAAQLAASDPRIRLIRLARNYGQTPAMQAGFDHARGAVVVTMDGDLQNDPRDIPALVAKLDEGFDLVAGYRVRRQDRWLTRTLPSRIANRLIRSITGISIRDNGCSLKAYRRELVGRLHLYSDMHRFIPAVAAATAGARIAEIPVRHHPRRFGKSKYGLGRIARVLADLLTIKMIRSFRERPLMMFAAGAAAAASLGLAFMLATAFTLLTHAASGAVVFPATALLSVGLACYLLMLGLVAETALHEARRGDAAELPALREVAW